MYGFYVNDIFKGTVCIGIQPSGWVCFVLQANYKPLEADGLGYDTRYCRMMMEVL